MILDFRFAIRGRKAKFRHAKRMEGTLKKRVYRESLTRFKSNILYEGITRECQIMITAYGDEVYRVVDVVNLSSLEDKKILNSVFGNVSRRYTALLHDDRLLRHHIQVNM